MSEERFEYKISAEDNGKRIDKLLTDSLSDRFSRVFIQKLIIGGHVRVNGSPVKKNLRIKINDEISLDIPETVKSEIAPEAIKLKIVYEDKDLLVVNKPAGMVTHPAPGNYTGTLVNALLHHCKDLSGIGGVEKPGIVHRLDKYTTGLMVVAKTDAAHKSLSGQFKDRSINKIYYAIVNGVVELDNGIIELPMGRHTRDRKKMAVDLKSEKMAKTQYKVLERFKDCTLLEIKLFTGRTHQIRVHMAHIEHPVMGDDKYGVRGEFKRPALHAKTIGFIHPTLNKYMEFTSDLPADMIKLLKKIRKEQLAH